MVGRLVAESAVGTARLHPFDKGCSPSLRVNSTNRDLNCLAVSDATTVNRSAAVALTSKTLLA